ncbi:MAG TPA: AraC family transcriptional regulator [Candidatus Nanopelagicales bacterium]|nr:AraC family transcriptional regulator [Candidatus Nanopelagicales bacterium]
MIRQAYAFVRDFDPAPAQPLRVDRHYLLYASRGALRLDAEATTWSLPPARAALIRAGEPIEVTIPQRTTTASVLFSPAFVAAPPAALTVVDMSPLCRALIAECTRWGQDDDGPLDDYATAMFRALAEATWALAARPSPTHMPRGRSSEVRRALELTARQLDDDPTFAAIAAEVGLVPRSLARRFEQELGMTWRAALRRIRVLRAVELLADGESSVTQIAMAVGYQSLSAFNAAFRDLIGQTPTGYRDGFAP